MLLLGLGAETWTKPQVGHFFGDQIQSTRNHCEMIRNNPMVWAAHLPGLTLLAWCKARTQKFSLRTACWSSGVACTCKRNMDAAIYTLYERDRTQWFMENVLQKRSKMAMMDVADVTHSTR